MSREAGKIYSETRNDEEQHAARLARLNYLRSRGAIDADVYARAVSRAEQVQSAGMYSSVGQAVGGAIGGPAGSVIQALSNPKALGVAGSVGLAATAFAVSQHAADEARAIRRQSEELNVSTSYFQRVGYAARKAGLDVDTISSALRRVSDARDRALMGDAAAEAVFRGVGVTTGDLAAMSNEQLMTRAASGVTSAGQARQVFGPNGVAVQQAAIAAAQGRQSIFELSPVELSSLQDTKVTVGNVLTKTASLGAMGVDFWMRGGMNPFHTWDAANGMLDAAEAKEDASRTAAREAPLRESAAKRFDAMQTPYERAARAYGVITNEAPFYPGTAEEQERTNWRARAGVAGQFAAAMSPLDTPLQRYQRQLAAIGEKAKGNGYAQSDEENAQRAAREVIQAELDLRASAQPGIMASGADVTSAAGYSTVIGAQCASSELSDMQKAMAAAISSLPAAIGKAIASQMGWQSRVAVFPGH